MSITYDLGDLSVRKIVIGKDCYSKYCIDCPYKVDAFWEKKEGFKYGWMGIICCKCQCPNGIGYGIKLGRSIDFDPEKMWQPYEILGHIDGYEDTKVPEKKWWSDD